MTNVTSYLKTLAAGATIAAVLAGCGADHKPYVIAAKDVSCEACELRNDYDTELTRMVDWVAERKGTIVVDVIDGNALASFDGRHTVSFEPDPSLGGNEQLIKDDLRAKARRARGKLDAALMDGGQTEGSDPLGFALAAAPVLRKHDDAYLVFGSDMIQHAPTADELDLYHPPTVGPEFDSVIKRLKAANKIPNLEGVQVVVIGGARSSGAVTADEAIAIKRFWQRLFAEAGAELAAWGPRFDAP